MSQYDYRNETLEAKNNVFMRACERGNIGLVKYLLTSDALTEHADIHVKNENGFLLACENGHLEIVKYLLTSSELKEHINIQHCGTLAFSIACQQNNLDIARYLLKINEVKDSPDFGSILENSFLWSTTKGSQDLIDFLIFEAKVPTTDNVIKFLSEDKEIRTKLSKRDLTEELDSTLTNNNNKPLRVKL